MTIRRQQISCDDRRDEAPAGQSLLRTVTASSPPCDQRARGRGYSIFRAGRSLETSDASPACKSWQLFLARHRSSQILVRGNDTINFSARSPELGRIDMLEATLKSATVKR